METMRNIDIVFRKRIAVLIGTSRNYEQKWITELCNY